MSNDTSGIGGRPTVQSFKMDGAVTNDYEEIHETERDIPIDELAQWLNLEIIYKGTNQLSRFCTFNINRPGLQLAGYYEHFSAERVQVLGELETSYLQHISPAKRKAACDKLLAYDIPCIVISMGLQPCDELIEAAKKYNRVILRSSLRTTMIMNELSLYLNNMLAPMEQVHGVLMDIYGLGVMIVGDSGIGKSETALELVQRGHRLVADDAVMCRRIGSTVNGTSPAVIRYFMEVRGIGIIDVRAMYGAGAVLLDKNIDLVVELEDWDETRDYDRLGTAQQYYTVLGLRIPKNLVPVKPGRNLAVILEAASRNHRLKAFGFNAIDELSSRLKFK